MRVLSTLSLALSGYATSVWAVEWRLAAPLPEPRWFHAAGLGSDGYIYAYGGYVRDSRGMRDYGRGKFALARYDPVTNTWNRGPEAETYRFVIRSDKVIDRLNERREMVRTIEFQDDEVQQRLVIELPAGRADPLGKIYWLNARAWVAFDPTSREWTYPLLPRRVQNPRHSPGGADPVDIWENAPRWVRDTPTAATSKDGLIYVSGGMVDEVAGGRVRPRVHESVEVYDAKTSEWRELAPMHHARYLHAAAVDRKGRLFVFGGSPFGIGIERGKDESDASWEARGREMDRQASTSIASVEMYDPKTNTWTERAPLPTPRQSMGADVGADGRIYVVGGAPSYAHPAPMDIVEIYDPETDRWEKGPSLYYPRRGHAVVATEDGRLYAIGGYVGPHRRSPSDAVTGQKIDPALGATVEMLDTRELVKGL
jgi:hypothetical protein